MLTIPRVVLDIDGVFANFNRGFVETLNAIRGRDGRLTRIPIDYEPPMWNYPVEDLLCSPRELDRVQQHIAESGSWWNRLQPYPGAHECLAAINAMIQRQELDATFVTCRAESAANVRFQTIQWLSALGITQPQVIVVAGSKVGLAQEIGAEAIVDDRPANLKPLAYEHLALFDRPWNQETVPNVTRVHGYGALLTWLASLPRQPFLAT